MPSIFHQATIMVVDDNTANLKYMSDILSAQEYRVLVFSNSQQALRAAEQDPPDMILLDTNMPELNGYELCTLIKAHTELKHIPVIFISALTDTREKIRAFECKAVDYITKPFEPEEVKARIKSHLSLARMEVLENEIKTRMRIEKQHYEQLDNLADAIVHINHNGKIVYCNPITEQYFGYSKKELLGQNIEILMPESQRAHHQQHRKNYLTAPTTRPMSTVNNIQALRKNGETFYVDISLSTLYSEEGLLVSAEIRDITEQLLLQNELENQQQFFEDAFSNTPDGILLSDNKGLIILANPSISNMLGYMTNELTGTHISRIFENAPEGEKISMLYKEINSMTKENSIQINFKHKEGHSLPAEVSIVVVKNNMNKHVGHFTIIRDISERLKMENEKKSLLRQLMQSQKMEALGQLTGGVAHDFNNILASVIGFTELSQDILAEEPDLQQADITAKLRDYLEEIHTAGNRAKVLIEQMLMFSRTGNNGALQAVNISKLVNEAVRMLRPVLPTSIDINAFAYPGLPDVLADQVQVQQMLINTCINARDAMNGKGVIDIYLGETDIHKQVCSSCQKMVTGKYLDLSIEDSGPGIDASILDRIFEPFFTTKVSGKGTGMGLAMVHGIIHHHHGHVIIDSKPGQGTSFRILFPLQKDASKHVAKSITTEHELA